MWHRVKDLWTHNRYLLLAFVTVVGFAGFFGVRATSQFIYWSDPAHSDQSLAGWMTPRYVSRSYEIPPQVIQEALGMRSDAPMRRVSLDRLAAENDMTLDDMQAQLDAYVAAWRAND
jgi:hypothetical protein